MLTTLMLNLKLNACIHDVLLNHQLPITRVPIQYDCETFNTMMASVSVCLSTGAGRCVHILDSLSVSGCTVQVHILHNFAGIML